LNKRHLGTFPQKALAKAQYTCLSVSGKLYRPLPSPTGFIAKLLALEIYGEAVLNIAVA
jgi:hypothetical protein